MLVSILTCFIALIVVLCVGILYIVSDKVPKITIQNSNFIVTGGSEGLGLALAIDIVKQGGNLVIISRAQSKINQALTILCEHSVRSHLQRYHSPVLKNGKQIIKGISANVDNYESISDAINKSVQALGHLDVLICNAGIALPSRFEDMKIQHFEQVAKTNYLGTAYTIRSAIDHLKARKKSRVICVSSLAGLVGIMGYSNYAPTKSAIRSLCECLHQEYYYHGVSFSVAFPGSIGTKSFYEIEQNSKPRETLLLEKSDTVRSPELTSKSILNSLENWRFLISPSGINSDLLVIGCAGMSPASFLESLTQILGMGFVRLFGLVLLNYKAKSISLSVRREER